MSYAIHILGHAERDIKKIFKVSPATATLIVTDIRKLSTNPRPSGHKVVVGQKKSFVFIPQRDTGSFTAYLTSFGQ